MSDNSPLGALLSSLPELFSDFFAACPSPPLHLVTGATVQQPTATVQQPTATVQQPTATVQQPTATVQQAGGGPRGKAAKKRKRGTAPSSQAERRRLMNSVPAKAPRPPRGARVCGTPRGWGWCSKPLGHLGNCGR